MSGKDSPTRLIALELCAARAALTVHRRALRDHLRTLTDPSPLLRRHPWLALTGAAAAGFFAAGLARRGGRSVVGLASALLRAGATLSPDLLRLALVALRRG